MKTGLPFYYFLMISRKFSSLFGLKCARYGDYQGMAQKTHGSLACDLQNEEWARKMFSFCPHEAKTSLKCLAKGWCRMCWAQQTEAEKSGLLWTTARFSSVESGNVLLNMTTSLKLSSFFFFLSCVFQMNLLLIFFLSLLALHLNLSSAPLPFGVWLVTRCVVRESGWWKTAWRGSLE